MSFNFLNHLVTADIVGNETEKGADDRAAKAKDGSRDARVEGCDDGGHVGLQLG